MKEVKKVQRNKVYLDEDEVVDVSPSIIERLSLNQKKVLDSEEYDTLIYLSSISKALFLLSRRDYSEKEILSKLKLKFKNHKMVRKAVEKIVEKGYIDDYSYAFGIIERSSESKKKLEYTLGMKGISRETVEEAFKNSKRDESENLRSQINKIRNKDKEKKIAYLMRKGFRYGDIIEAIRENEKDS